MYSRVSPHRRHSRIYKYMARPGDRGGYKNHRPTTARLLFTATGHSALQCTEQSTHHLRVQARAQRNPLQSPPHNIENMEHQHALISDSEQDEALKTSLALHSSDARGRARWRFSNVSQMRTTVRAARPRGLTAEAEPTHCAALHPSRTRGASGGGGGGRLADERSRVGLSATSRSGAL